MRQSMLVFCVVTGLLVLLGCHSDSISRRSCSLALRTVDLKAGTIQLSAGFSERMTGTKDSRRGEVFRNDPAFVVTYDIGYMAGLHMSPREKDACLWFKESLTDGQKCYMGMKQKGSDKILTISIVPSDNAGLAGNPWTYPANFWAIVKTDEDVEIMTQIALSYLPKPQDQINRTTNGTVRR